MMENKFKVGDLVTWSQEEQNSGLLGVIGSSTDRGVVLSEEEGAGWKICLVHWSCGTEDWYPTKILKNLTES